MSNTTILPNNHRLKTIVKPKIEKIIVESKDRPRCAMEDCERPCHHSGSYNTLGYPRFRLYCEPCHEKRRAIYREKVANADTSLSPECAVPECTKKVMITGTTKAGDFIYTTYCEEHVGLSSAHLAFRKDYCENIDSRLGYPCTTTIMIMAQLEVDHMDGNPYNNDPSNLQTLCGCCHKYKSMVNRDFASPGRKALKKEHKTVIPVTNTNNTGIFHYETESS